jgi:hypothetical protein
MHVLSHNLLEKKTARIYGIELHLLPVFCAYEVNQGFYQPPLNMNISLMQPIQADKPLKVVGGFAMTRTSRIDTSSLAIIHFTLKSIPSDGAPPQLVADYLSQFFTKKTFLFEEVAFDLPSVAKEDVHKKAMDKLADKITK